MMQFSRVTVPICFLVLFLFSCSEKLIDGYVDATSYFPGDSMVVFLNGRAEEQDYSLSLSDISGNQIEEYQIKLFAQAEIPADGYATGFGYKPTTSIVVPDLRSGIYLLDGKIPFVVKSKQRKEIVVVYASNTINAYNEAGGKSLYPIKDGTVKASNQVSFQRPIGLPWHSTHVMQWFEGVEGIDVKFICDRDLDDYDSFGDCSLLVICGHSEYWSRKARVHFDSFVDQGGNALVLSGNSMWWQVRYNAGGDLICYKYFDNDTISNELERTVMWRDTSLHYSIIESIGADFEYGGYGLNDDKGWDGYKIVNAPDYIFGGVDIEQGEILRLPSKECDGAPLLFSSDSSTVTLDNVCGFYRYELIGYDLISRKPHSNMAWVIMQKDSTSGTIINVGSTDWCAKAGVGGKDGDKIKKITLNMIDYLLGR
ncbi:MAG: hypothetical protein GC193_00105 [Cryomorphaceae bacterium]|nr:hypothetical protein [Cryomorphaceae bacterium]